MEATMIIQMEDYRTETQDFSNGLDYRDVCGNTVRRPKFDMRILAGPVLPDLFDDFNAKEFIDRAYGLATQI
jgi:hypothetical protein